MVTWALSRLLVYCAKMHGVAMFHAAAVMASHLSIAAARNCRIVLREIRWDTSAVSDRGNEGVASGDRGSLTMARIPIACGQQSLT